MPNLLIGWTTAPTLEEAQKLARGLVEARLAACVHIQGPITAYFHWEGRIDEGTEYRLVVKLLAQNEPRVREWLRSHHPYKVPQWVAVRVEAALPEYAAWVAESTDPHTPRN